MQTQLTNQLPIEALLKPAFAGFGDVIEIQGEASAIINQGNCKRYTDLAAIDIEKGRAGISLFQAEPYTSPFTLTMMERHPLGTQTFLPLSNDPFLVIVAEDINGKPDLPKVFMTDGKQGVNYYRNTWHSVLTPIRGSGLFAVVDRIGAGPNLEEYPLETPYIIEF